MNILVAADSFKDALPAGQVCAAISRGISAADPAAMIRCFPLADGGEGTFDVLAEHLDLQKRWTDTCDPVMRPLRTFYGISSDGKTAFIEMAQTAGLQLLQMKERNPLFTTTYGFGQQIADAVNQGVEKIVLAIGGSATSDGGTGMAYALGWQFYDKDGLTFLPTGGTLHEIVSIAPPEQPIEIGVSVICDVNNPLYGELGATQVYARQKGANEEDIAILEVGMRHFARVAEVISPGPEVFSSGAGAAGGMGFGAMFFLNAQLRRGIDLVLDLSEFDRQLKWADLVVTGEGKLDHQTAHGKLIEGLCKRAGIFEKPVIAFCGQLQADEDAIKKTGLKAVYCINEMGKSLGDMLAGTASNLERTAFNVFLNKHSDFKNMWS